MRGTMLQFEPKLDAPVVLRELDRLPTLEELQDGVGGYIESVPGFTTIAYFGVVMRCVALCNEHGKLEHQPLNETATNFWAQALRRDGLDLFDKKTRQPHDWLVGSIVVLFGDREFMSTL